LDHHGISRQRLVETKDEQVKDLMVNIDLQVRELSERAWKHILETVIYHCDPEDRESVSSEFAREVDNNYYSMKEKFEKISELLVDG
jgi:ppGpp synthetase/RelA/SpoT-type nucleotidyltranferase